MLKKLQKHELWLNFTLQKIPRRLGRLWLYKPCIYTGICEDRQDPMKMGRQEDRYGGLLTTQTLLIRHVTHCTGHSQAHILKATQTDHLCNLVSGVSAGKESAFNAGDLGSIPRLGRCPGEGKGYPLQYSGLENAMDCIVHGVAKSWTWLVAWITGYFQSDYI